MYIKKTIVIAAMYVQSPHFLANSLNARTIALTVAYCLLRSATRDTTLSSCLVLSDIEEFENVSKVQRYSDCILYISDCILYI